LEVFRRMARRRTKKEKKQHLKGDQFRDGMFKLGKGIKEYQHLILLVLAIAVLLYVVLRLRGQQSEETASKAIAILRAQTETGPEELRKLAQEVGGTSLEPWVLLRLGRNLYDLYQKQDALLNDKVRLNEARKVFQDVLTRFPKNHSTVYISKQALDTIDKELSYDAPEDLRDAYEKTLDAAAGQIGGAAPPGAPGVPRVRPGRREPPAAGPSGNQTPEKVEAPPEEAPPAAQPPEKAVPPSAPSEEQTPEQPTGSDEGPGETEPPVTPTQTP
jgi:hypothetical protein